MTFVVSVAVKDWREGNLAIDMYQPLVQCLHFGSAAGGDIAFSALLKTADMCVAAYLHVVSPPAEVATVHGYRANFMAYVKYKPLAQPSRQSSRVLDSSDLPLSQACITCSAQGRTNYGLLVVVRWQGRFRGDLAPLRLVVTVSMCTASYTTSNRYKHRLSPLQHFAEAAA